jgi:threonine dehydratase
METPLTLAEIRKARERLHQKVIHTPLIHARPLEAALGCCTYLKPEMFQITGSFKARGALNKTLQLTPGELAKGIISSSSGNHAQALAYAGRLLGAMTTLVIPSDAPINKIERTRAMGAEVILFEGKQAPRWALVHELVKEHGYTLVHAFDDPVVMAGQGTLALEILQDLTDVDTVVVPLGGGGLLSGTSVAIKESLPRVRVVGVEPALAPKYYVSRQNGEPTHVPAGDSLADGVKAEMACPFAHSIFQKYVDEIAVVDEKDIVASLRLLAEHGKILAEGAAAVGIAAVLSGKIKVRPEEKVCFVLSGGNWDLQKFSSIVQ